MDARVILGWNLRRLRVAKGLSQERLALAASIDRAYVGRVERGEENVTINVVAAVAEALEVAVADLFAVPPDGAALPASLPPGRRPKSERA